jgi:hypothetical protein
LIPSICLVQLFRRARPRHLQSPLQQALDKIQPTLAKSRNEPMKPRPRTLPWWCLYIAYACSVLIMIVSIFFIIVRGIEFGDTKTQQWLASLLTSVFSSIILIQPLKVSFTLSSSSIDPWNFLDSGIDHALRSVSTLIQGSRRRRSSGFHR